MRSHTLVKTESRSAQELPKHQRRTSGHEQTFFIVDFLIFKKNTDEKNGWKKGNDCFSLSNKLYPDAANSFCKDVVQQRHDRPADEPHNGKHDREYDDGDDT